MQQPDNDAEKKAKAKAKAKRLQQQVRRLQEFIDSLKPEGPVILWPQWPYIEEEPAIHRELRFWWLIATRFELYLKSGLPVTRDIRIAYYEADDKRRSAYRRMVIERRGDPDRFFGTRKPQPET